MIVMKLAIVAFIELDPGSYDEGLTPDQMVIQEVEALDNDHVSIEEMLTYAHAVSYTASVFDTTENQSHRPVK